MPLTLRELVGQVGEDRVRDFFNPPANYADTDATHWVNMQGAPFEADPDVGFSILEDGTIYIVGACGSLYSDLPHRESEENPVTITAISHGTLLFVEEEGVGPAGQFNFVAIVSQDPALNDRVGYVRNQEAEKLPGIPPSLAMVFDTCSEPTNENVGICDFTAPIWWQTTEPYFNRLTCEYSVSITTEYTDTGDDELDMRMDEQIPLGAQALLEYYNKERTPADLDKYFDAFRFADATAWFLTEKRLKVLVTIPARYFDAIPEAATTQSPNDLQDGTARVAFLQSDLIGDQIDTVISQMRRFQQETSWKNVDGSYTGPDPNYGEYSFDLEISNLEDFVSNLTKFLSDNRLALRTDRRDSIEIGLDSNYAVTFILINAADIGSKNLKIGFEVLKRTNPFNYPRTMAYISRIRELSEEIKRDQGLKGGWKQFLESYTAPQPEFNPEAKTKNCKPTLSNPFKCVRSDFKKYLEHQREDLKCGVTPTGQKLELISLGDALYDAIKSGAAEGFEDKFASMKLADFVDLEEVDREEFARYLTEAGGPEYDFVGDPSFKETEKNTRFLAQGISGRWGPNGAQMAIQTVALRTLGTVVREVASKVKPRDAIRSYMDCKCREIADRADRLEAAGDAEGAAARRLVATGLGCADLCGAVPILCSCLPFDFPPKFKYPNIFPLSTVDIMGFITALILNAIVNAIIQFLIEFINSLLADLANCERTGTLDPAKTRFLDNLNSFIPDDDLTEEAVNAEMGVQGLTGQFPQLVRDTATLVTPAELCALFSGTASLGTLQLTEVLITEQYPAVRSALTNLEKIRKFYVSVGNLIDPGICDNLSELLGAVDIEPSNTICDETDLREEMLLGRATSEQIREQLDAALACDTGRMTNLINIARSVASGEDTLADVIPDIFKSAANPNGIIPREPPSVKYLQEISSNTIFNNVQTMFYGDMENNIPTLITTTYQPENSGDNEDNPLAVIANNIPGLTLPSQAPVNPGVGGAVFGARILDYLLGLEGPLVSGLERGENNSSFIVLELPDRRIRTTTLPSNFDINQNLLQLVSGIGLIPETNNVRFVNDSVRVEYNLCPPPPANTQWAAVKDAYGVALQRWSPGAGEWVSLFNFASRKRLSSEIRESIFENFGGQDRLDGTYNPPQQAFTDFLNQKWIDQIGIPQLTMAGNFIAASDAPDSAVNELHAKMVQAVNESYIRGIGRNMASSNLFAGTFSDQIDAITELGLVPDPSCGPNSRPPGILDIEGIIQTQQEAYVTSRLENPQRYVRATKYALALTYIRVFASELLVNGIIPFSYLRVQDLMSSDLLIRYFLNEFKDRMQNREFYIEIATSIQEFLSAKIEDQEKIFDPLTGEEVVIIFGPVNDISFSPVETNYACTDAEGAPDPPPDPDCDIVPNSDRVGELSDDVPFVNVGGVKTMGYMEYAILTQFKQLGDELEKIMGTSVFNLTDELFAKYLPTTDAAVFGADFITAARFTTQRVDDTPPEDFDAQMRDASTYGVFTRKIRQYLDGDLTRDELEVDEEFLEGWRNFLFDGNHDDDEIAIPILRGIRGIPVRNTEVIRRPDRNNNWPEDILLPWTRRDFEDTEEDVALALQIVLDLYEGYSTFVSIQRTIQYAGQIPNDPRPPFFFSDTTEETISRYRREEIPSTVTGTGERIARNLPQRPPQLSGLDTWSSWLEAVHDIAFGWILDEASSAISAQTVLNTDFSELQTGGFYTERFIRIYEKSPAQWEETLASLPNQVARDLAISKIRDRGPELRGVVNIRLWQRFLEDLQNFNRQLGLYTTRGDRLVFNIQKYFQRWEFGERLMWAYPFQYTSLSDTDRQSIEDGVDIERLKEAVPEMENFREFVNENLKENDAPAESLQDKIRAEKAYILKESPANPATMVEGIAERSNATVREILDIVGDDVTRTIEEAAFEVLTLPLITGQRELQSEMLSETPIGSTVGAAIEDVSRAVASLFTGDMQADLQDLVDKFNNLIVPEPAVQTYWNRFKDNGATYANVNYALLAPNSRMRWLTTSGEVLHPKSFNDMVPPTNEFANMAEVATRIHEISKQLFGFSILDTYQWSRTRERVRNNPNLGAVLRGDEGRETGTLGRDYPNQSFSAEMPNRQPLDGNDRSQTPWNITIQPQNADNDEVRNVYPLFDPDNASALDFNDPTTVAWAAKYAVTLSSQNDNPNNVKRFQDPEGNWAYWLQFWDPAAAEDDDQRAFAELKNFLITKKWSSASSRWGGLFFIWIEVQELLRELAAVQAEFGGVPSFGDLEPEQLDRLAQLFDRIEIHLINQMRDVGVDGQSAVTRCFFDANEQGDPLDQDFTAQNRPSDNACAEYDRLRTSVAQVRAYQSALEEGTPTPVIRDLSRFYNRDFRRPLRADIAVDPQFAVLFKYIYPMPRLHSLVSMYAIEHVSNLPGRLELFDRSKELVEELYYSVKHTEEDTWWRKDNLRNRRREWWEKPLNLPLPLIIALTPFKILEALFILVPPLKWILGMTNWRPKLPPYRRSVERGKDPCREGRE